MPVGVYTRTEYHRRINSRGHMGLRQTTETRHKISASITGNGNPFYGRTHSKKTRLLMRAAKLGKSLTQVHKAKIQESSPKGELSHLWRGGLTLKPDYRAKHNRLRLCRIRAAGKLRMRTLQSVYEENIKKYGTLTCVYCKLPIRFGEDSVDHRVPVSRHGTNKKHNLAIVHKSCNSKKHNLNAREYLAKLRRKHVSYSC